jgi:hypothetical protein
VTSGAAMRMPVVEPHAGGPPDPDHSPIQDKTPASRHAAPVSWRMSRRAEVDYSPIQDEESAATTRASHLGWPARRRREKAGETRQGPASDAAPPCVALSAACGPSWSGRDALAPQGHDLRCHRRRIAGRKREIRNACLRIARAINRAAGRGGKVFADHYYARELRTPAEARRAIRYVLDNAMLHGGGDPQTDPCASTEALVTPQTWLLRIGWLRSRAGPLPVNAWDTPAARRPDT